MVNRSKAYYNELDTSLKEDQKLLDSYIRIAEKCKQLYALTKNRRGIYRLINLWAKKENEYWCSKGTELALKNLEICEIEIDYLSNYLESEKP